MICTERITLPYFDSGVLDRRATLIRHTTRQSRELTRGLAVFAVHKCQIGITVDRQFLRIKRSETLPRCDARTSRPRDEYSVRPENPVRKVRLDRLISPPYQIIVDRSGDASSFLNRALSLKPNDQSNIGNNEINARHRLVKATTLDILWSSAMRLKRLPQIVHFYTA